MAIITSESAANPPIAPPMIAPRLFELGGSGEGEAEDGADAVEEVESAEDVDSVGLIVENRPLLSSMFVVTIPAFSWPRYVKSALEARVPGVDEHL
jgi:hypothetical protein